MALPILPVRLQTSIVGRSELNFRVRDGNGWTLALISTNYCNAFRNHNLIIFSNLCQEIFEKVVTRTGFEPSARGFGDRCSTS